MNSTSDANDSISRLDEHADGLLEVAQAFQAAAGQPLSSTAAPAALGRLEEALQTLSASWYELAADAAPGIVERRNRGVAQRPSRSSDHGLSREQEAHLMSTLHDVAAALARCARSCRQGRPAVTSLIAGRASDQLHSPGAPALVAQETPAPMA